MFINDEWLIVFIVVIIRQYTGGMQSCRTITKVLPCKKDQQLQHAKTHTNLLRRKSFFVELILFFTSANFSTVQSLETRDLYRVSLFLILTILFDLRILLAPLTVGLGEDTGIFSCSFLGRAGPAVIHRLSKIVKSPGKYQRAS